MSWHCSHSTAVKAGPILTFSASHHKLEGASAEALKNDGQSITVWFQYSRFPVQYFIMKGRPHRPPADCLTVGGKGCPLGRMGRIA